MAVNDECKLKFQELKSKRSFRFITFKIDEHTQQVVLDRLGKPGDTYDDFTASMPDSECRYAVFDFDFTTDENCQEQDLLHLLVIIIVPCIPVYYYIADQQPAMPAAANTQKAAIAPRQWRWCALKGPAATHRAGGPSATPPWQGRWSVLDRRVGAGADKTSAPGGSGARRQGERRRHKGGAAGALRGGHRGPRGGAPL